MIPGPAYTLFRGGKDTLDIAQALHISEPEALKQVSLERAEFKHWKENYPKAPPRER